MKREETLARNYLTAVADKDLSAVERLLAADVTFVGPVMSLKGSSRVIEALRRISAVHVGTEIRRVFVDDLVTEVIAFVGNEYLRGFGLPDAVE